MAIRRSTTNKQDLPPVAQPQLAATPAQDPRLEKRRFAHRARLALTPAQVRLIDDQAHAARA
ncbi:hypothetical protein ABT120_56720, partial [Nonomuraea angiospora]|uniref:hypothetical protein n=1 Tax=Nonomuraea angiospora TaxID=46172 RepID=UPI003320DB6E